MTSQKIKWRIEFTKKAEKELKGLSKESQEKILKFLFKRVMVADNPLALAERLTGDLRPYFRYRVSDYRIMVNVKENTLVITVIRIAHRREIYKKAAAH